eukprot:13931307-Ditylum_brightwellii.AAC.1
MAKILASIAVMHDSITEHLYLAGNAIETSFLSKFKGVNTPMQNVYNIVLTHPPATGTTPTSTPGPTTNHAAVPAPVPVWS